MKKITIIGNYGISKNVTDGGRIKIRLFFKLLSSDNICDIVDLDGWKKKIFNLIGKIRRAVKESDVILIMAGPKGCRFIISLVNLFNKKLKKRIVYCPVGIGTIDYLLKKNKINNLVEIENRIEKGLLNDRFILKELHKLDCIILENDYLKKIYDTLYKIADKTFVLTNFRDEVIIKKDYNIKDKLNIVFASRVCEEKGIFDLIEVVNQINCNKTLIKLDIFGELQLSETEEILFNKLLNENVQYKGTIMQKDVISVIRNYDLFVLPTKYYGEGTPGALVEALISGVPVLVSGYSQAKTLISDNIDGFIFEFNNKLKLKEKLMFIHNNRIEIIERIGTCGQEKSRIFLYEYNKDNFINLLFNKGGKAK